MPDVVLARPPCPGCAAARVFLAAWDALDATTFSTTRRHHIVTYDQALAALRVALSTEEEARDHPV